MDRSRGGRDSRGYRGSRTNPWQQPDPNDPTTNDPTTNDPTTYEPSRSLRDLILERMTEQQTCLDREQARIAERVEQLQASAQGPANGQQGPGDTQVSAADVKQITSAATSSQQGYDASGRGAWFQRSMGNPPGPPLRPNGYRFTGAQGPSDNNATEPMARYQQLQAEIDALLLNFGWPAMRVREPFQAGGAWDTQSTWRDRLFMQLVNPQANTPGAGRDGSGGGLANSVPPQGTPLPPQGPPHGYAPQPTMSGALPVPRM
ncbi:hypothetical protein LTR56_013240 [Elasticomyces elasticus]|nr:hypothetical protein LTR56_013240 [Elasticomyces elasticus]KAK3650097.1 hypothetical protein LTR22_012692 [Elasticomyces elasticus]KAK4920066.1 hypothetical protein LTR49_012327 [Elasticomyces elasticus]KAK5757209.1 hypothetical protein LTS12_012725 [Elasticomyces elasticus]